MKKHKIRSPPQSPGALPTVKPVTVVSANASPESFARHGARKARARREDAVDTSPTSGDTGAGAARYLHLCKRLYALPDPTYAAALDGEGDGEYSTAKAQVREREPRLLYPYPRPTTPY